jgi:hypothetical protein
MDSVSVGVEVNARDAGLGVLHPILMPAQSGLSKNNKGNAVSGKSGKRSENMTSDVPAPLLSVCNN